MNQDRHVSIRLPASLVADLQKRAKQRDEWDLSKEIRRALKLYVAKTDEETR